MISLAFAIGVWAILTLYDPGQKIFASPRTLVFVGIGVFAVTMAVWSRLHKKKDQEL